MRVTVPACLKPKQKHIEQTHSHTQIRMDTPICTYIYTSAIHGTHTPTHSTPARSNMYSQQSQHTVTRASTPRLMQVDHRQWSVAHALSLVEVFERWRVFRACQSCWIVRGPFGGRCGANGCAPSCIGTVMLLRCICLYVCVFYACVYHCVRVYAYGRCVRTLIQSPLTNAT